MANYSFKKQAKVYIFYDAKRYLLDVTEEISFSQTFTDKTYSNKTLHNTKNLFEQSNIKKANPANFSFVAHALVENDLRILKDLIVDYKYATGTELKTFDLYIDIPESNDTYKLEKCVITNGTFMIEKLENLRLGIQGQASKLSRVNQVPSTGIQARSSTATPQRLEHLSVTIDNRSLNRDVYNVSVELQNNIKWTPYETVNDALNVTSQDNSMFPSNFTLEKRVLSGSVSQYVSDANQVDIQKWATGKDVVISAGKSSTVGFTFNIKNCTFTNRVSINDVFSQTYDWKMNDNPTDLGDGTSTARSFITFNNA